MITNPFKYHTKLVSENSLLGIFLTKIFWIYILFYFRQINRFLKRRTFYNEFFKSDTYLILKRLFKRKEINKKKIEITVEIFPTNLPRNRFHRIVSRVGTFEYFQKHIRINNVQTIRIEKHVNIYINIIFTVIFIRHDLLNSDVWISREEYGQHYPLHRGQSENVIYYFAIGFSIFCNFENCKNHDDCWIMYIYTWFNMDPSHTHTILLMSISASFSIYCFLVRNVRER